jgi:hypothetical protein
MAEDAVFIPAAFDMHSDVRIGDWIQVLPERFTTLFVSKRDEALVRPSATLYFSVSANSLTARVPLEFGGSDWEPTRGSAGQVTGFRNTVTGATSQNPGVLEPVPLPDFANDILNRVEGHLAARDDAHRREARAKELSAARVARGLDPVFGNPVGE